MIVQCLKTGPNQLGDHIPSEKHAGLRHEDQGQGANPTTGLTLRIAGNHPIKGIS